MQNSADSPSRLERIPALDGIRGYGFLGIFFAHYLAPVIDRNRSIPWVNSLFYLEQIAWMAVPTFFVLSGYLIGGILFNSRNHEGFFRVFYGRRILRILPVYYGTLIILACVGLAHGVPLRFLFWSHFIYIQNLAPRVFRRGLRAAFHHHPSLVARDRRTVLPDLASGGMARQGPRKTAEDYCGPLRVMLHGSVVVAMASSFRPALLFRNSDARRCHLARGGTRACSRSQNLQEAAAFCEVCRRGRNCAVAHFVLDPSAIPTITTVWPSRPHLRTSPSLPW